MNGALNEYGALDRVLLKHAREAFRSQGEIDRQWGALGFLAPPDFRRALAEYERFIEILASTGAELSFLPQGNDVGLDSIYVRDAAVAGTDGLILGAMGKALRAREPDAIAEAVRELSLPVGGRIAPPGKLEGGDLVWLDERTALVGRGYRTNDAGIAQLRKLLGEAIDVQVVPLPHWNGPGDVFHLMSILSPVDRDLAVAYSPLLPIPVREALLDGGIDLVEVPNDEFESLGANVLALGPRRCVMLDGNSVTRSRLERAGAEVFVFGGEEIARKGGGGPTCLTRPVLRRQAP